MTKDITTAEPPSPDGSALLLDPASKAGMSISEVFGRGDNIDAGSALMTVLDEKIAAVKAGDLSHLDAMRVAQAYVLDAMFTDFTSRATANRKDYPDAADRYTRLALKAQSQCSDTIDKIARLHQPREQTVVHKHFYFGPNGQAIIADQFHLHGGFPNAGFGGQAYGAAVLGAGPALPGSNPLRAPVYVASDAERTLSNSRGQIDGCAEGQQECVEARREIG